MNHVNFLKENHIKHKKWVSQKKTGFTPSWVLGSNTRVGFKGRWVSLEGVFGDQIQELPHVQAHYMKVGHLWLEVGHLHTHSLTFMWATCKFMLIHPRM